MVRAVQNQITIDKPIVKLTYSYWIIKLMVFDKRIKILWLIVYRCANG